MNTQQPHPDEHATCDLIQSCGGFVTHATGESETRANSVNLQGGNLSDSQLLAFDALPEVYAMTLGCTGISDAGVQILTRFEKLGCLFLNGTGITNNSFDTLVRMSALEMLNVEDTEMTVECCLEISKQISNCLVCYSRESAAFNGALVSKNMYDLWTDRNSGNEQDETAG